MSATTSRGAAVVAGATVVRGVVVALVAGGRVDVTGATVVVGIVVGGIVLASVLT